MNAVLQNLFKLQALEFGETAEKHPEAQVAELRGLIPTPILAHYDRLRVRGKKGVSIVRNQTCTGCHLRQPIGKITIIMRGEDVQLCDSCGRYLFFLPEAVENKPVESAATPKPAQAPAVKRPRKRKALAQAA